SSIALMPADVARAGRGIHGNFSALSSRGTPFSVSRFMSDKLTEIMAWKRREIAPLLRDVSDAELARADAALPRPPDFGAALRRSDGRLAVISEIKRRSPSAGDIKAGASALDQAER